MEKEKWYQRDSVLNKDFWIKKRISDDGRIDIFVGPIGKKEHDHGWIRPDGTWGYEDRGISKK